MQKEEQDSHIDSCFSKDTRQVFAGCFFVTFRRKEDEQLHLPLWLQSRPLIAYYGSFAAVEENILNRKLNPLTENHLFTKAFTRGVSESSKLCAVYILKNIKRNPDGSLPKTKTGIAINAKLGGAVQRNRVKRIIREGTRPLYENLSDGLLVIISARGAAFSKKAKSTAMRECIDSCFNALGAYKGQKLKHRDISTGKTFSKNTGKNSKKK